MSKMKKGGELESSLSSSAGEVESGFSHRLETAIGDQSVLSFAKKCGVSDSLVRKYLGGSLPGLDKLLLLAKAAEVRVGWLATGEPPMREDEPEPQTLTIEGARRTAEAGGKVEEDSGVAYGGAPLAPLREPIEKVRSARGKSAAAGGGQSHLVIPVTLYVRLIEPLKEMTSGEEEREWVINRIGAVLDELAQGSVEDMLELREDDLVLAMKLVLRMRDICGERERKRKDEQTRLKEALDKMRGNSDSGYF